VLSQAPKCRSSSAECCARDIAGEREVTERVDEGPRKGRPHVQVGIEAIRALFDLPLPFAASALGMSLSVLKSVCRKNGIEQWPYRRSRPSSLCAVGRAISASSIRP